MKRGDIFLVDLGPGVGRELGGVHPVVVVTTDILLLVPWMVAVVPGLDAATYPVRSVVIVDPPDSGFPVDLVFVAHHVRAIDPSRLPAEPAGRMPPAALLALDDDLRKKLQL